MVKVINLSKYSIDTDCLTDMNIGRYIRIIEDLEDFDICNEENHIEIIIPEHLIGFSFGFLSGLFNISLKVFDTKKEILNKVKFKFLTDDSDKILCVSDDIDFFIRMTLDKRTIEEILK